MSYDLTKPVHLAQLAAEVATAHGWQRADLSLSESGDRATLRVDTPGADAAKVRDAIAAHVPNPKFATSPEQANEFTLRDRAAAALDANKTYLALSSPTAAQNLAQIRLLTRECSALIRLALRALDTVD